LLIEKFVSLLRGIHLKMKNYMLQSTTLDARTVIVRADADSDIQNLLIFLNQTEKKKREKLVTHFLDFAKDNYVSDPSFKFNRDELYDR